VTPPLTRHRYEDSEGDDYGGEGSEDEDEDDEDAEVEEETAAGMFAHFLIARRVTHGQLAVFVHRNTVSS
jgi:hypothetical protein